MPSFLGSWVDRVAIRGSDAVVLDSVPFASRMVLPKDFQKVAQFQYLVISGSVSGGRFSPRDHAWYQSLPQADADFITRAKALDHDLPRLTRPTHRTVYGSLDPSALPMTPNAPPGASPSTPLASEGGDDDPDEIMREVQESPKDFMAAKTKRTPKKVGKKT